MSGSHVELFKLFKEIFDPKNTGYFNPQNVEAAMIANGFLEEKAQVLSLMKYLEPDRTGKIPIEDVEALLHPDFVNLKDKSNIQDMFEQFDKDMDSAINMEDLRATCEELGYPLTEFQAQLMIRNFSQNKDGKVTLEDFNGIFEP